MQSKTAEYSLMQPGTAGHSRTPTILSAAMRVVSITSILQTIELILDKLLKTNHSFDVKQSSDAWTNYLNTFTSV